MKLVIRIVAVLAMLVVGATPALAAKPEDNPGQTNKLEHAADRSEEVLDTEDSTDETATDEADAEDEVEDAETEPALAAPGQYCKAASRKRVKGQKGTAFSACVKAQARLRSGKAATAKQACKAVSKKHVKGQKGTPFSACIKAAKAFIADEEELLAAEEEEAVADETLEADDAIEADETISEDDTSDLTEVEEG